MDRRKQKMIKAITYYRVSTERQGKSGLGLDAQQSAVRDFALANGYTLIGEFTEVESGKKNNRPVLLEALASCKKERAMLLIAKLDRLGRSVAFVSKLMESGVDFKAVDNPFAGKFMIHVMVAFAEHERDLISLRTKASLKIAKERGTELGSHGRNVLSVVNKVNAQHFAKSMSEIITRLQADGFKTIRAITSELNRLNIPTYSRDGTKWHPSTVHAVIKRAKGTDETSNH